MKLKKRFLIAQKFWITFAVIFSLFSCQEEETEIVNPEPADIIETDSELNSLLTRVTSDENNEDAISSIDFEYPISISIFDTSFDVADTENIDSDIQFSSFLETLEDDVIASLNYPVTLFYEDLSTIQVENNQVLENTLAEAITINDSDPAMVQDCTQATIIESLPNCKWNISRYSANEEFEDFIIFFNENNTLSINDNTDIAYTGRWEIIERSEQLFLTITTEIIDINWQIVECESDAIQASGNDETIIIREDCTDDSVPVMVQDCTQESITENLLECSWTINTYSANEEFEDFVIFFNDGNLLSINDNTDIAYPGTWDLIERNEQLFLTISTDIIDINWQIVECEDDSIQASGSDETIIIEKKCNDVVIDEPNTTEELAAKELLIGCPWSIDRYNVDNENLFSEYSESSFQFINENLFVFRMGDSAEVYRGSWDIETNEEGALILVLDPTLPDFIDHDYQIDTLREGFTLWSAVDTDLEIVVGFEKEQDCE